MKNQQKLLVFNILEGPSGGHPAPPGVVLGQPSAMIGLSRGHLGGILGILGPPWGDPGVSLRPPWGHLGYPGANSEPSWGILGSSWPSWAQPGHILGASRGHLRLSGPPGAILGLLGRLLGAILGPTGPPWTPGLRKTNKTNGVSWAGGIPEGITILQRL